MWNPVFNIQVTVRAPQRTNFLVYGGVANSLPFHAAGVVSGTGNSYLGRMVFPSCCMSAWICEREQWWSQRSPRVERLLESLGCVLTPNHSGTKSEFSCRSILEFQIRGNVEGGHCRNGRRNEGIVGRRKYRVDKTPR